MENGRRRRRRIWRTEEEEQQKEGLGEQQELEHKSGEWQQLVIITIVD